MSEKTKIGTSTGDLQRADQAERLAGEAAGEITMIRRRIRTFYNAITYVQFPAEAPAWSSDWSEWLQFGVVPEKETPPAGETPTQEPIGQDGSLLPPDETVI